MKFLKKQKDYYALCYIYNWLVLLIGPPLSFFALILLAFGLVKHLVQVKLLL